MYCLLRIYFCSPLQDNVCYIEFRKPQRLSSAAASFIVSVVSRTNLQNESSNCMLRVLTRLGPTAIFQVPLYYRSFFVPGSSSRGSQENSLTNCVLISPLLLYKMHVCNIGWHINLHQRAFINGIP